MAFQATLSLYLPFVESDQTEEYIKQCFKKLNIGDVSRVDFILTTKGTKQAFIHFNMWYESNETIELQRQILDPSIKAKIAYNMMPYKYWPLLPNSNPRVEAPNNIIQELQDKIKVLEERLYSISLSLPQSELVLSSTTLKRIRSDT